MAIEEDEIVALWFEGVGVAGLDYWNGGAGRVSYMARLGLFLIRSILQLMQQLTFENASYPALDVLPLGSET